MNPKFLPLFFFFFSATVTFSQRNTIDLTFTALDRNTYVQLDSIKVMNRTLGKDTVVCWPDTTLTLEAAQGDLLLYVGYSRGFDIGFNETKFEHKPFELFQNHPNPFKERTTFIVSLPERGNLTLRVFDTQGREKCIADQYLEKGNHVFRFISGEWGLFVIAADWNGIRKSIKTVCGEASMGVSSTVMYTGRDFGESAGVKITSGRGVRESGILDASGLSGLHIFQFAANIPCPSVPTVEYEGQTYNTVQVFSQCWLKENLNVGEMIQGNLDQAENGITEKYCFNDDPVNCTLYGGLYQWNEMMQYTGIQAVRGICPPGWHVPTDEEWKVLEGAADTWYGIGDPIWDYAIMNRGHDAGTNLKSAFGWKYDGNGTDLYGFGGFPGGVRFDGGLFYWTGETAFWWTSSKFSDGSLPWYRCLSFGYPDPGKGNDSNKTRGFSVRCIMDQ